MDPNTAGQDAPDSEALVKVDDLWFTTDTIIVIRAGNKIFRVSGGILAARSTVFRDMIAFPRPKGGDETDETLDGSPVVRLHDSAEDVEVFLRAIYDSSYFMPAPAPNDRPVVLAILRLSYKYDVPYLYKRALDHLAADGWYTTSHDEEISNHLRSGVPDVFDLSPMCSLQVIQAATEVSALWLLPWAYYFLSTFSSDDLLPLLEGSLVPHVGKALAAHSHLVRATVAINRLHMISCDVPQRCEPAHDSVLLELLSQVSKSHLNPLGPDTDIVAIMRAFGMCSDCCELAGAVAHTASSRFWDDLPSIFGLPPWDELHAMKNTAMGEDEGQDLED
ncbi:hypothetical protein B0H14DRAFT_2670909 [Mycena olivaceomarginata]|nr:hypothetical protein B0H14DRAFT_2670909 [Mycena olivaceomarginata]